MLVEAETKDVQKEQVRYRCPLAKSTMADIIIIGPDIGKKDLAMLRRFLELAEDALGDKE